MTKHTEQKFTLSDRMKEYENITRNYLIRRTPVILRLDGKAFSSYTKNFKKPFDENITAAFVEVAKVLLKEIQGASFVYGQSDEISVFIRDYDTLTTESYFGNNLQKIVSVSASIATAAFNENIKKLTSKENKSAIFDARVFNIPKDEVVNYFIFRQNDIQRNSVQMIGQSLFSHTQLQDKSCKEITEMISDNHPDWNPDNIPKVYTRGFYVSKTEVNLDIPLFKEDRQLIENIVYIKE